MFQIYIQVKWFHPYNSTDVNLVSCDMYLWRFLDILVDPKDPSMTQKMRKFIVSCRKNVKGGHFGLFQHTICCKTSKNRRIKKSHNAETSPKGGPYSLIRFCILRLKWTK